MTFSSLLGQFEALGHLPLLVGFAAALLAAWAAARWLGPRGFMDLPKGRHLHERPTPRTGGLALMAVLGVAQAAGCCTLPLGSAEWAAVAILALTGAQDDRHHLPARLKALGGLAVALLIAWPAAARIASAHLDIHLLGLPIPAEFGWVLLALVLLYWSIPHAYNLIDGADGLALGFALTLTLFLSLAGRPEPFFIGALLGTLLLNWPRARHFLGDAGALPLGLILALLVKKEVALRDPNLVLWAFAYLIVDTSLVTAIRLATGQPLGKGDRNHLHHQWMDRFPGHRRRVVPGLLAQAALCASALVVTGWAWLLPWAGLALLVGQALVFFGLAVFPRYRKIQRLHLKIAWADENSGEFPGREGSGS